LSYATSGLDIVIGSTVDVPPPPAPAALAFTAVSGPLTQAALTLTLPAAAHVEIALYSVAGRRIATLCERDLAAGVERFRLADLAEVPRAGVGFARARIATSQGVETRRARIVLYR
jgi:hypothetical protein